MKSHNILPGPSTKPDKRAEYALYRAIVRLEVEASDFTLNSAVSPSSIRKSITAPSIRAKAAAANRKLPRSANSSELSLGALRRMKEYLDVGSMLPDGRPDEIRGMIRERFERGAAQIQPDELQRYKRFNVTVCLTEDGGVWWEYHELPGGGDYAPGVDEEAYGDTAFSNLHIYLQNLIKADIQSRIERLAAIGR